MIKQIYEGNQKKNQSGTLISAWFNLLFRKETKEINNIRGIGNGLGTWFKKINIFDSFNLINLIDLI